MTAAVVMENVNWDPGKLPIRWTARMLDEEANEKEVEERLIHERLHVARTPRRNGIVHKGG